MNDKRQSTDNDDDNFLDPRQSHFRLLSNNQQPIILHTPYLTSYLSLNIILHSFLLSTFSIFRICWCLVSGLEDDTRYDTGETEVRRYLLWANASYLPVSLFITPSLAQPRLSDVRARDSPNLRGAEQSQHLFYISQFLMVQLRHTSS